MTSEPNGGVCLIRRVVIRNYKSIAACDVELGPLTFLVGPNGSGKSNFLDALRFVSDALRNSLDFALRDRGGINSVRKRIPFPVSFGIRVEFQLPDGWGGHFAFEVGGPKNAVFVFAEECLFTPPSGRLEHSEYYVVREGQVVESTLPLAPRGVQDRLYLVNASGHAAFKPVFDALSSLGFYSLNPDTLREFLPPGAGEFLLRDGANLPSVLASLAANKRDLKKRIEAYLAQVVPGISGVDTVTMAARETLEFRQTVSGAGGVRRFPASSMSDGTLRALGVLVALFQGNTVDPGPGLVGLEEPETGLHPAAAEVLIDSIRDATSLRQVIVTSHSPDLLDNPSIADSEILAVVAEDGDTRIGHLDEAGRTVLRDHLFTAGDLLRMNQLRPAPSARSLNPEDVELFGTGAPA
jgi:ABC-type branched-subunit amino acid transport system ATPase component